MDLHVRCMKRKDKCKTICIYEFSLKTEKMTWSSTTLRPSGGIVWYGDLMFTSFRIFIIIFINKCDDKIFKKAAMTFT